jgi:hypothetical protein
MAYVANLQVDQIYPQKQAGEFGDTSIVVPSSVWPSLPPKRVSIHYECVCVCARLYMCVCVCGAGHLGHLWCLVIIGTEL